MYRNKNLLQAAKNHACVACGADDGTIVAAHSDSLRHGKGTGIKSHDIFIAFFCARCHDEYAKMNKETKHDWFREQNEKTLIIICNNGYL